MTTAERITTDRASRGLPAPDARGVLLSLAISAGYTFTQIVEQWRSGRGDERTDLPGGHERWLINNPDGETLIERAMRDA